MTNTTDPLRALRPLREEEVAELSQVHEAAQSAPLAYDVYRAGDELVIAFDAPGVSPGISRSPSRATRSPSASGAT